MARVERIRNLEFESRVPVKVITREEFQQSDDKSVSPERRTLDNVKYEALFMVNESTDSLAVQRRNSGTTIGGFYSPEDERIVVVSGNTSSPTLDELTLGHELVHALQDQHFDLSKFNRSTREQHNSADGLVEGDANYVQYLYEKQCNRAWKGTCLGTTEKQQGGTGSLANVGPYLLKFHPYSDGPPFLKAIRNGSGWKPVDALYDDPPTSTEQIIHPERYGVDQPAPVTLRDRSNGAWKRLAVPDGVDYGELGEAGLFSMFVYPGIATQGNRTVIPPRSFLGADQQSEGPTLDPYNYSHPITAGWDGDKLAVYVNDGTPPNETGYVWKTVWDSKADAREFARAYRKLLRIHGAASVEGRANTWVVPDDREFADAFFVERRGDVVVIVNAPTADQLSGVHGGVSTNSS